MSEHQTYEYAEMVAGFFNRGVGVAGLTFMWKRDLTGDTLIPDSASTPDFEGGFLGALNLMGAQGWQLVSEKEPTQGAMEWIAASLRRVDDRVESTRYYAREYLMMRAVRD